MTSITDASFCQETVIENGVEKRHRSQKAVINCLVSPDILKTDDADIHIINWQSVTVTDKKACNSTLQAEAHAMISGTDLGDKFRAIINSMRGKLDLFEWENSTNRNPMRHLWLSDCSSLVSHLKNPIETKLENTRLSIDMAALRQRLWADHNGEPYEELPEDDKANNIVRWIDTSVMIADCLTKRMKATNLWPAMRGKLSLTPTPESILTKMRKQKARKKTKEPDPEDGVLIKEEEADETPFDGLHDEIWMSYQ